MTCGFCQELTSSCLHKLQCEWGGASMPLVSRMPVCSCLTIGWPSWWDCGELQVVIRELWILDMPWWSNAISALLQSWSGMTWRRRLSLRLSFPQKSKQWSCEETGGYSRGVQLGSVLHSLQLPVQRERSCCDSSRWTRLLGLGIRCKQATVPVYCYVRPWWKTYRTSWSSNVGKYFPVAAAGFLGMEGREENSSRSLEQEQLWTAGVWGCVGGGAG